MVQPKSRSPRTKAPRGTAEKSPSSPARSKEPFLRFHHPAALRKKTLSTLTTLEAATDPTKHRAALADIVVELTQCGMESYFIEPLKESKAGFITEQSAALGMSGAVRVLSAVIRNVIGGMGAPQLISVCGSIRGFME